MSLMSKTTTTTTTRPIDATLAPARLRSLYRAFLRELPPRSHGSSQNTARAHRAEQYLVYLRAQRTYLSLLERYNPGLAMDAGREQAGAGPGPGRSSRRRGSAAAAAAVGELDRERVVATARRVGMRLPQVYDPSALSASAAAGAPAQIMTTTSTMKAAATAAAAQEHEPAPRGDANPHPDPAAGARGGGGKGKAGGGGG
ncbi:MAG: hypothetical protein M1826_003470 [Phylliscum demangeonii]|nr:MAG: hypothetical protein M1826_003470 [Phylliscum demangeonii]